jgi:hypothetical protein
MSLLDPTSAGLTQVVKWAVTIVDPLKRSSTINNEVLWPKLYKTSTPANGIWETGEKIQHTRSDVKPFELLFPDEKYTGDIGSQVKFDRDVGSMSINGKKIFDSVYIVDRFISSIGPANQSVLDGYYTAADIDLGMRKNAFDAPINQFEGFYDKEDADVASNFQRNPRVNHNLISAEDFRVRMLQLPIASQARTAIISKDSPQLAAQLAQYLDGGAALPDPLPVEEQGNFLWHVSNTEQSIDIAGVGGTYQLVADLLHSHPTPIACSSKNYVINPWELKKSTTLDHFCWNHAFFVPTCFGCEGLEKHVGASTLRLKGRYSDNTLYSSAPLEFDHTHNLTMPDIATGGRAPKCVSVVRGTNNGPGTDEFATSVSLVVQPEGFGDASFGNDQLTDIDWAVEYNCGECFWKKEKDILDGTGWIYETANGLLFLVNSEGRRTTMTQMVKPWWPDDMRKPTRGSEKFLVDLIWSTVAKNVTYENDGARIIDGKRFKENWQDPATTWRLGTGDCEDMAMLLTCMLLSVGIDARFVSGDMKCPNVTSPDGHAWVQVPASIYPTFPATADGYINLEATSKPGSWGKPHLCDYIPAHATSGTNIQKWTLNRWEEVPALKVQSIKPGINNVFLVIKFRINGTKFDGEAEKRFNLGKQIDVRQYEWSHITPNSVFNSGSLTYQRPPFLEAFIGTSRVLYYPGIDGSFQSEVMPATSPATFKDIGARLEMHVT